MSLIQNTVLYVNNFESLPPRL